MNAGGHLDAVSTDSVASAVNSIKLNLAVLRCKLVSRKLISQMAKLHRSRVLQMFTIEPGRCGPNSNCSGISCKTD